MLNNFPIFNHARNIHFSIKAFSQDRLYLLFIDQMAAFYKHQTSEDVGRYRDICFAQMMSEFLRIIHHHSVRQLSQGRAAGFIYLFS